MNLFKIKWGSKKQNIINLKMLFKKGDNLLREIRMNNKN